MKLKDMLEKTAGFFRDKGFPSARLDAELLLSSALGIERIRLYLDFERPVSEEETVRARELVRRRGQGEPVAYILGRKDFFGLTFEVGAGVLIPRPETEHLVENALEHAKSFGDRDVAIVDLGAGSGCAGLSFLKSLPRARAVLVDMSPEALAFTKRNAESLGVADRVIVLEGDAASPATRDEALRALGVPAFDVVIANPPYIAGDDPRVEPDVRKFEPAVALFAEDRGLAALKSWSGTWAESLTPAGLIAMEMGTDQGPAMKEHFQGLGLDGVGVIRDYAGHDRIIRGVRHG